VSARKTPNARKLGSRHRSASARRGNYRRGLRSHAHQPRLGLGRPYIGHWGGRLGDRSGRDDPSPNSTDSVALSLGSRPIR
jgi:hypothetical protein